MKAEGIKGMEFGCLMQWERKVSAIIYVRMVGADGCQFAYQHSNSANVPPSQLSLFPFCIDIYAGIADTIRAPHHPHRMRLH